ncbi:hypothetical protein LAUMK191_04579 [Mycobacterium attenuatum]|uniref:Uncharacterized protein n=1 Tax=Mycobacterium attenuatum TaxID=2341086 RepID=A0A498QDD6_9MYCO|nr:hypothetical protein LAUMK136_04584 [Mycobacterium attenuatum]VBA58553.1 hypothetical protein LAUMK191_04579 [Mycobacterium attenuatum]VBA61336.1 hypothetical protein LAUMK41_04712 [Mycobacterium attenuatum]
MVQPIRAAGATEQSAFAAGATGRAAGAVPARAAVTENLRVTAVATAISGPVVSAGSAPAANSALPGVAACTA